MTVSQYDTQFTQLSRYAKHLILTEKARTERFINRLCYYFFDRLILIDITTYQQALNQLIHVELCAKERREREGNSRRKKPRNEGGNFKRFGRANATLSAPPKGLTSCFQNQRAYFGSGSRTNQNLLGCIKQDLFNAISPIRQSTLLQLMQNKPSQELQIASSLF